VGIIIEDGSAAVVQGVTINGQPLAQDVREIISAGYSNIAEFWSIGEAALPVAGSYTLSVNLSTTVDEIALFICNLVGVKDQPAEATTGNSVTNNTTVSDTLTTVTDNALVLSVAISGDGGRTLTPTQGGQTLQGQADMSSCEGAISSEFTTTAGDYTHGFTNATASNRLAIAMASYEESENGEPSTPQVVSTYSGSASGSPLDFTVTLQDYSSRVLGALISTRGSSASATAIDSVVLDPGGLAINLTEAFTQYSGDGAFGFGVRSSIWYLLDTDIPSLGSYTLRITSSGSAQVVATAILLRATKQEAPFADAGTGTVSASSTISTNISTAPNNNVLIVDVDAGGGFDITGVAGSGQTLVNDLYASPLNHMSSYKTAVSSGTYSMSWSFSGNLNIQAHSVVAFAAAPITAIDRYATWFGGGF